MRHHHLCLILIYLFDYGLTSPLSTTSDQSSLEQPILLLPPDHLNLTVPTSPANEVAVSAPAFSNANNTLGILSNDHPVAASNIAICDKNFGTGLELGTCYNAVNGINPEAKYISFTTPAQGGSIQLPHRMSSGKRSPSALKAMVCGRCRFLPGVTDRMSLQRMEHAFSTSGSEVARCPTILVVETCSAPRN